MSVSTKQLKQKKVPKLRFPCFSGEWDEKRLGDITRIYDGTHQTPNYVKNGVPFYSVEHLTADNFSDTKFISEDIFEKENKRVSIEKGDILMTRIGDIGTARLINWNVRASFYVSLALIKKSEKIESHFLSQYISSSNFQRELWKRTIHVAFPKKINLGEIGECKLFAPYIPEQQKIADFLGAVDRWIENLRAQKKSFEKYKKGMMQKIFSQEVRFKDDNGKNFPEWEEKKIVDMFKVTRGYVLAVKNMKDSSDDKYFYPVYSSQTKNNGLIGYYNDYLYEDAITWTTDGANAGNVNFRKGKFYCTNVCGVLISKDGFANSFIANMLNTVTKKYVSYVGNPKLMNNIMLQIKINVPALPEQQKIADFLTSIDNLIESKQQQINQAEIWKKGLMQGLFV